MCIRKYFCGKIGPKKSKYREWLLFSVQQKYCSYCPYAFTVLIYSQKIRKSKQKPESTQLSSKYNEWGRKRSPSNTEIGESNAA